MPLKQLQNKKIFEAMPLFRACQPSRLKNRPLFHLHVSLLQITVV